MSYILEALRKAERERSLGQVPSIETGGAKASSEPRRLWPWLLGGALLVNAGVLAVWLLLPREPAPTPVPEQPARTVTPESQLPPAVSDYLPPPTTVVEEPISEPPVAALPEPVEPRDDFVDEPAGEAPAIAAPSETTPVAEEPPLLRDMPPEFRRNLPEMKIDAHFHTDVPGRSFVMINLRRYKPGERLSEGPQVVEIVAEGVVLSYQGREFLLTP
jgi:general secretion pathway protein B